MSPPSSKTIPWKRLIAEGGAIVVSILLAFAIDAWWDDRQERVEERQILQDLEEEFSLIRDTLTRDSNVHLWQLQNLEEFLRKIDAGPLEVTPDQVSGVVEDLLSPRTSDISNGTLHALLGSGRLEIISRRTLREKLVGWESAIEEVWDDQQAHAKLVHEVHIPYFVAEGFGMADVMGIWYPGNTVPTRSIGNNAAELNRLLEDSRFRSIVEARFVYKLHLTEEFEEAIAAAEEILAEIRESE